MKLRTYSLQTVRALEEEKEGLLLDLTDIPEEYELILRPIRNKKNEQIVYINRKEHI